MKVERDGRAIRIDLQGVPDENDYVWLDVPTARRLATHLEQLCAEIDAQPPKGYRFLTERPIPGVEVVWAGIGRRWLRGTVVEPDALATEDRVLVLWLPGQEPASGHVGAPAWCECAILETR